MSKFFTHTTYTILSFFTYYLGVLGVLVLGVLLALLLGLDEARDEILTSSIPPEVTNPAIGRGGTNSCRVGEGLLEVVSVVLLFCGCGGL